MNYTMQTSGQIKLAIEMLTRAGDMRIAHRKRLSLLRYAHEVMLLNETELDQRANELHRMIVTLSEYAPDRIIHSEIKAIVREVRDALQEYHDDTFSNDIDRKTANLFGSDDIPF